MIHIFYFVFGILLGVFISSIWEIYFKGILELNRKVLEHYHAGIALLILSYLFRSYFLLGLGLSLIADERVQDHPFAIGKENSLYSHVIGISLLGVLCMVICIGGV